MVKSNLPTADQIFYVEKEGTVWGPWDVTRTHNGTVRALIGEGVKIDIPRDRVRKTHPER